MTPFSPMPAALGLIGAQPPAWFHVDIKPSEARFDGRLVTETGTPLDLSITLTPDAGAPWKLFSLRTATGGRSEDRFTLVGKGTGFNDVYHQPMPSPTN